MEIFWKCSENILVTSDDVTYTTTFTSYLKDDVGVGIPNESISYSNLNPSVGTIGAPTCITGQDGSCEMNVGFNYNQVMIYVFIYEKRSALVWHWICITVWTSKTYELNDYFKQWGVSLLRFWVVDL